jgi:hypothetical protein
MDLTFMTAAFLYCAIGAATAGQAAPARTAIDTLRVEYMHNPLGIDVLHPRFSWQLKSPPRGVAQSAYHGSCARRCLTARAVSDLLDAQTGLQKRS